MSFFSCSFRPTRTFSWGTLDERRLVWSFTPPDLFVQVPDGRPARRREPCARCPSELHQTRTDQSSTERDTFSSLPEHSPKDPVCSPLLAFLQTLHPSHPKAHETQLELDPNLALPNRERVFGESWMEQGQVRTQAVDRLRCRLTVYVCRRDAREQRRLQIERGQMTGCFPLVRRPGITKWRRMARRKENYAQSLHQTGLP